MYIKGGSFITSLHEGYVFFLFNWNYDGSVPQAPCNSGGHAQVVKDFIDHEAFHTTAWNEEELYSSRNIQDIVSKHGCWNTLPCAEKNLLCILCSNCSMEHLWCFLVLDAVHGQLTCRHVPWYLSEYEFVRSRGGCKTWAGGLARGRSSTCHCSSQISCSEQLRWLSREEAYDFLNSYKHIEDFFHRILLLWVFKGVLFPSTLLQYPYWSLRAKPQFQSLFLASGYRSIK